MVSLEKQVVPVPCSNIESITPANLMKFYMKPVYEAQYHFRVHERTLRIKMKEFKMHFKDFFAHIPSKNTKLSEDEIRIYDGKPIWEAAYHLQVTESSLRSRVKALKLGLWRSSSASASASASASVSASASASAYANPQDLLQSLVEGKGWIYGIVWDLEGSCVLWNTGYIVKEQPEMMPSDTLLEDSLNDRQMDVLLKLSGHLFSENIRALNKSVTDIQWFYLFSMFESISVGESLASRMLHGEEFLLSQTSSLFHSGWEHAQDAASFGLQTLILIPSDNQQVVELGSKDIISETTLEDSVKRVKAFFNKPASGRKLKRKHVTEEEEEELEFKVVHNGKFSAFNLSKKGICFEKVHQSVAEAFTLQRDMFFLEFLYEDYDAWYSLRNDYNLNSCIEFLQGRVTVHLRTKSKNI